jgi:streptogramin lyase
MLDPQAKDPHSIAIDPNGMVWFTVQNGNMLGRIDSRSGDVKLVPSPTPNSRPYGIVINSKDVPVFVEFGSNKIATIDPKTMAIKEHALPNAASRPRRLALTPDDVVWYTDFPRGYLGRLDLETGAHKEWPSPSGPKSQPYGIVFTKGALWTTNPAPSPTPSCASTRRRRSSRAGRFPAAATSSRTWTSTARAPGDRQQPGQPGRRVEGEAQVAPGGDGIFASLRARVRVAFASPRAGASPTVSAAP